MGKWLLGIICLAIVALVYALIVGPKYSGIMGSDIERALSANGYENVSVEMHGHVATLKGEVASMDDMRGAVETAQTAECSNCEAKSPWHKVLSDLTVKKVVTPVQTPYTFDIIKDEDGSITLNGFVENTEERDALLMKARSTFSGTINDNKIKLANGAPDANWLNVIQSGMDELNLLEKGRFQMEDTGFLINGEASSVDVRNRINEMSAKVSAPYSGAANIQVENLAADAIGDVTSKTICQSLFDDLKSGREINFESARAEIKGNSSFDLLGELASAANQCESFRIKIEGHTDSLGDDDFNQDLSERRANTVLAFLSAQGVARDRMSAVGYGETLPIADNSTAEGRVQNRRTAFTLTQVQ
ncbi:BON domain-containing protein [Litorimonas taeanensis]|uniref:BON domain-containing protein n=1 Tax=Litorimonas taeanensis TaxID=568099 RepID=A0A420WJX8_9PROT|nr:OmpA family protein [Litorimonas taeanensis]RKQ71324.1 BON domain-containing protein [Litorimonas taeanensis]